jgi:predicted porin
MEMVQMRGVKVRFSRHPHIPRLESKPASTRIHTTHNGVGLVHVAVRFPPFTFRPTYPLTMMKKTIIALAVLTIAGASSAQDSTASSQLSITGNLSVGFRQTQGSGTSRVDHPAIPGVVINAATAGAESSGFGIEPNATHLAIAGKRELGSGQTIEAMLVLRGADHTVDSPALESTTRDATLTYTNTSIGRLQLGSALEAPVLSGIPTAGAPVIDMDAKLFQLRTTTDYISYAAPIGPVIFQFRASEPGKGLGIGLGTSTSNRSKKIGQRTNDYVLMYVNGPLQALGAFRTYDNQNSQTIATVEGITKDTAAAIQVGYDFGAVKLGFGLIQSKSSVGPGLTDSLLGVSIPAGPWTFGLTLGRSSAEANDAVPLSAFPAQPGAYLSQANFKSFLNRVTGTANSISVGVKYDLDKSTNVSFKYATWDRGPYEQLEAFSNTSNLGELGYTDKASEARIVLSYSF